MDVSTLIATTTNWKQPNLAKQTNNSGVVVRVYGPIHTIRGGRKEIGPGGRQHTG